MKALQKHCNCKWVLLYVARWLKAPMEDRNGNTIAREKGTPQGGVVSPILANLFLHYVFDKWIRKEMPKVEFCRYADDGILHCQTQKQAEYVLEAIGKRFEACGLTINKEKSGIIYCKDQERKGQYERVSFDFLGYRFMPRRSVNKQGRVRTGFLPAISQVSKQAIVKEIRGWHIQLKNAKTLEELAKEYNAAIRGWYGYYGKFYPSAMRKIWEQINWYLVQWVRRKYKKLAKSSIRAREYLNRLASRNRDLFMHWKLGVLPEAEMVEAV